MRLSFLSARQFLVSLLLLWSFNVLSWGQAPPKQTTPEQQAKLKERDGLKKEALALEGQGKLTEAIAITEKMLTLERAIFGDVHKEVVDSLKLLARLHEMQEGFAEARARREEVLTLQTRLHGEKAWQVTDARLDLQTVEQLARLDPKARQELREADQWMNQAVANYKPGKYQEGAACAEKALAIRLRVLGEVHHLTGRSAGWAGTLWERAGQLKKARPHYEQALAIRKKVLGANHPDTAMSFNNLGALLREQGDYTGARPCYEQALAIRKKTLGEGHPLTAWSLNSLGLLLAQQGDYAGASRYYGQALAIREKALGKNHPDTAQSLNNLGALLSKKGDYAGARPYYEQALAIRRKVLGDDHPDTAQSLSNLGFLLEQQGDYASARLDYEQALAIRKKTLGEDHADTAQSLNNLGALLRQQGDYVGARTYYEQALAIRKKTLGEDHPATAWSLNSLGLLLSQQRDYVGARTYYEQALAIRKKTLGANHPDTAQSLNNLGLLLSWQGDYAAARPYYEQALVIRKKVLGESHPDVAMTLNNLAALLRQQEDYPGARVLYEQALAISRRSLDLAAIAQSERQQLLMVARLRYQFHNYLSLPGVTEADTLALYTQVLAWKGSVLAHQQRLHRERQHPELVQWLTELRSTCTQLAHLAFAAAEPRQRDVWNKQIRALTERKEQLERSLAQKSQTFRRDQELQNLTPRQLLAALPADTALVDFLAYRHGQPDPLRKGRWLYEHHLNAFVLKPGKSIVRLDLGPMKPIENAIGEWRRATKKQPGKHHPGMQLRRLMWSPLEKYLAGAKTVLISPDGVLGQFPFAALPGDQEGRYLLEEVALTVVPVPRLLPELLRQDAKEARAKDPSFLVVGDVDFDAAPSKALAQAHVAATGDRSGERRMWKRLPATKGEMLVIRDAFEQRFAEGKIKLLRGEQATESMVAELAPKYSHLHLATHGFFAPPWVPSALGENEKGKSMLGEFFGEPGVTGYHPGLMSGLVLAGANRPFVPGQSDGIVTALEVAEWDLSHVELAVLSACETGLGKVAAGEGILGLQRAFQVAGAKSVVASLWSIDDEATRKLMEQFYENLWQKKMSKQEAVREAQLKMLRGELVRGMERESEGATIRLPPYYWAAFVLSGDWR